MKKLLGLFLVCFVGLNGWGQYNNIGVFTKINSLSNLTDGYYVIVNSGDGFAMNNTYTSFLGNTAITPSSGNITNPSSNIVWKIESNGSGYTIFNNIISKYISYSGTANDLQITSTITSNNQRWNFSYSSNVFSIINLQLNTRILQYNSGSPRFACYASAQQKLLLYKLNPTITGAASTSQFTTIQGTASATQTFAVVGESLTANLIATAPTGFEVSSDGTTYGSTATFTQSSGSASGTLSIRLAASATVGSYNSQAIVLSSTGATSVNITTPTSGNVVSSASAPTCPSSNAINPSTDQTLCQGSTASILTNTTTNVGSTGTPTMSYQWYYNATNSNTIAGATLVSGATNSTYLPLSTPSEVGTRYYFCVAYATDNSCAQTDATQSLASNAVKVSVNALPASPTGSASQTFCYGKLISDLSATGTNLKWYDAATGGNLVNASTVLANSMHYYATQTVSGCESANRLDVTVTLNTAPAAPTGSATQTLCSSSTVANLVATGTDINWYAAATGGVALVSSTALSAGNYYATQTVNTCESTSRLAVAVTLNSNAIPSNVTESSLNCSGFTANWDADACASGYALDVATTDFSTVTFASENFENAMSLFSSTGGVFYTNSSTSSDLPSNSPYYSTGNYGFGVSGGTTTITSNSINTSNYSNVQLSFNLASFSVGSTGNGADVSDIVSVEISPDGGANYYSTLRVLGNSNATWPFSASSIASTNYDGNVNPVDFSASINNYGNIIITSLPIVTNLKIRINLLNNSTSERWIIDNLTISGAQSNFVTGYQNLSVATTSQAVTGLAPNKTYYFRVRSTNGGNTSANSTVVTAHTFTTSVSYAANDYVWTGTTSADWSNTANWAKYANAVFAIPSTIPTATSNVIIPANTAGCVLNQPTISSGNLIAKNVTIAPASTFTMNTGTLDVKGDFTNNGTFTAGTGTVSFTGSAAQQVTGATTFYNLTENNAAGLTLNSPVTVSNNLTMTAGNITTTSTNLLTLGNNAPATLAWTSGKVVGPMKRWMAAATNSGASSSLFPLGNATRKAQASIEYTTAPTTAGYLEAKFVATSPANAATNPYATLTDQFNYVLDNVVTEGYWEINPSATSGVAGGTYTVTLEGETISLAASSNASYTDVRVIKSPDPHTSWILQGDHGTATGTNADFTVSRTGMSGYSFFAMAFPSAAPLPVELVSFSAICEDNNTVSVNWTTASEHNSDYYKVEKSRDGMNWNILATKVAAGNSTQLINYSVADNSNISGTVYYRLTQVDVDGASKMYDIVSTNCSSEKELALIAYPIPSNGQFTVKIENALGGKYALAITDMQGKAIEEQSLDLETGTTVVKLNPIGLQPGVYLLQFMQDGIMLQQQKLIIE
jgi:hypothetical protein